MSRESRALRQTANLWRSKLDADDLTDDQRREFETWVAKPDHARAFAEAELLWHSLGKADLSPPQVRAQRSRPRTSGAVGVTHESTTARPRSWPSSASAAFAVALSLLLAVLVFQWPSTSAVRSTSGESFRTAIGEVADFSLGDGSRLTLGARSEVRVTMGDELRRAELVTGEALFDVISDEQRPFLLRSGAALVRVTGTTFTAKRAGDSLRVGVLHGAVEVLHPSSLEPFSSPGSKWQPQRGQPLDAVNLRAGEQVTASRDAGLNTPATASPHDTAAWREGKLVFFRTRLEELAADVSRYSAQELKIATDVQDLRVTATFDATELARDTAYTLSALQAALPVVIDRTTDGSLSIRRATTDR